jgi:UDP-glucose 6-dehydrogenase
VPTPLGKHNEPDLTYVLDSTRLCAAVLRKGQLVVLESTTYPGTTRQDMQPILEATGLVCGEDFFLAYSPEREDPGRKDTTTATIPKLVAGVDHISTDLAMAFYPRVIKQVTRVSSAEVAETAKLLENIFRGVNIALVNELKVVLADMGIDIWEVIAAASTKPFGFMPFYPGPGLGGHCIWTLLSFLLYGSVSFIIVVGFEGYKNNEIYLVAAFLILAAGGGLYLRNENPWKKFLSLFGGLTLSMLVMAMGQTILYEISFPNSLYPWWTITTGTVVTWMWLALIMLLPLAINLLPCSEANLKTS